jgi:hypothetical protein
MPSIRSARFTKAIPPHDHVRNPIPNPASRGSPRPPPWSVDHLNSPHTPSKPHTSTALAAYCKSPYRHRSAPTDRQTHTFLPAERCRYGTRDFVLVERTIVSGLPTIRESSDERRVSSKPLARRTLRVSTGHFLCVEPSLLKHNEAILTCSFSQRRRPSQAVVKRSNSTSTIEFP